MSCHDGDVYVCKIGLGWVFSTVVSGHRFSSIMTLTVETMSARLEPGLVSDTVVCDRRVSGVVMLTVETISAGLELDCRHWLSSVSVVR